MGRCADALVHPVCVCRVPLQACAEVAARYSKVMDAAERQQLAAAVAPLALEAVAPPSAPPAGAASTAH